MSLSLTGPLALQGRDAARGLQWWADHSHSELLVRDDRSSARLAASAYRRWSHTDIDLLLGPYGSHLVRRVAQLVAAGGAPLWNHGGAADDLARPQVVTVAAPASSYFQGAVKLAHAQGLGRIILALGPGPFSDAVGTGAELTALRLNMVVEHVPLGDTQGLLAAARADTAVLVAGSFQEDVALVGRLRETRPGLLGCVAAGLPEFATKLGADPDGVIGPVQWLSDQTRPEVGPSGAEFAAGFAARFGAAPTYVAAQAAATAFLAAEACNQRIDDVRSWRTTTLLGAFELNEAWRQVGHAAHTVRWRGGRQVPVAV